MRLIERERESAREKNERHNDDVERKTIRLAICVRFASVKHCIQEHVLNLNLGKHLKSKHSRTV